MTENDAKHCINNLWALYESERGKFKYTQNKSGYCLHCPNTKTCDRYFSLAVWRYKNQLRLKETAKAALGPKETAITPIDGGSK